MCYSLLKWKKFTPNDEFLEKVKDLTTIGKLQEFLNDNYTYEYDKPGFRGDIWKKPDEFLRDGVKGDCEDISRFNVWVLRYLLKREAYFGMFTGFYKSGSEEINNCHAMAFYKTDNGWGVFDNRRLYYIPEGDFISVGKSFYKEGLKYIEILKPDGKVIFWRWKIRGRL